MSMTSGLPLALHEPLDYVRQVRRRLSWSGRRLLDVMLGPDERSVFYLVRTGTCVDVGRWFGGSRVWLVCLDDSVVVFAPGRFAKTDQTPYARLRGSTYNHVTGELLLVASPKVELDRLLMSPVEGRQVLAQILQGEPQHAS